MTRPSLLRPTLVPGLCLRWRDQHTLQVGLDPTRAVVLELADPAVARLLDLLDGRHTERGVLTYAVNHGIDEAAARALLDALRASGLLVAAHTILPSTLPEAVRRRLTPEAAAIALQRGDAPATPAQILRRRAGARVVISGSGRLAVPVAVALAEAGVGHVGPAQQIPAPAIAAAIRRAAPETDTRAVRREDAAFVVHLGADRPANLLAAGHARRRRPHLMLAVRDGTAVVGPLVPPAGTPCLNCLDLHRQDRDPAWPALAAQVGAAGLEPASAPTILVAAGYAAAEVLAYLDGGVPDTVGATVEISAPSRVRRRSWPAHPRCDCGRRRR
jgi:hypothetical protein